MSEFWKFSNLIPRQSNFESFQTHWLVYLKMSAKNVKNISIFHISSCQTSCQGKYPNKLNNNFLIKLKMIIFLGVSGRLAKYCWTSDQLQKTVKLVNESFKYSDVINMGWMVCMNNVQKPFRLWLWQEIWISLWTRNKALL